MDIQVKEETASLIEQSIKTIARVVRGGGQDGGSVRRLPEYMPDGSDVKSIKDAAVVMGLPESTVAHHALNGGTDNQALKVDAVKVIRHVRDTNYWHLPYGTPLVGGKGKSATPLTHLTVQPDEYHDGSTTTLKGPDGKNYLVLKDDKYGGWAAISEDKGWDDVVSDRQKTAEDAMKALNDHFDKKSRRPGEPSKSNDKVVSRAKAGKAPVSAGARDPQTRERMKADLTPGMKQKRDALSKKEREVYDARINQKAPEGSTPRSEHSAAMDAVTAYRKTMRKKGATDEDHKTFVDAMKKNGGDPYAGHTAVDKAIYDRGTDAGDSPKSGKAMIDAAAKDTDTSWSDWAKGLSDEDLKHVQNAVNRSDEHGIKKTIDREMDKRKPAVKEPKQGKWTTRDILALASSRGWDKKRTDDFRALDDRQRHDYIETMKDGEAHHVDIPHDQIMDDIGASKSPAKGPRRSGISPTQSDYDKFRADSVAESLGLAPKGTAARGARARQREGQRAQGQADLNAARGAATGGKKKHGTYAKGDQVTVARSSNGSLNGTHHTVTNVDRSGNLTLTDDKGNQRRVNKATAGKIVFHKGSDEAHAASQESADRAAASQAFNKGDSVDFTFRGQKFTGGTVHLRRSNGNVVIHKGSRSYTVPASQVSASQQATEEPKATSTATAADNKPLSMAKRAIMLGRPLDAFNNTKERQKRQQNEYDSWVAGASEQELIDHAAHLQRYRESGAITASERATAKIAQAHIHDVLKKRKDSKG